MALRYIAVWGETYYPEGGLTDHHDLFATLDEALVQLAGMTLADPEYEHVSTFNWAHIWDLDEDEQVFEFEARGPHWKDVEEGPWRWCIMPSGAPWNPVEIDAFTSAFPAEVS